MSISRNEYYNSAVRKFTLPKNIYLKIIVILFIVSATIYFLPFIIGGYLTYFAYKSIGHKIVRYSIAAGILLPTLLIGTAWAAAFTEVTLNPNSIQKISPTPTVKPTILPTTVPTNTPTPSMTPETTTEPTTTTIPTATPKIVTPTNTPTPTKKVPTPTPTVYIPSTQVPAQTQTTGGSYTCNCSKTCPQISSCEEAQYLLNVCGCSRRDGDNDGIACDAAPLHCQN